MVGYAGSGDPADAPLYSGAGNVEHAMEELFRVTPEVNIMHLALTVLSIFVTFFGLFSGFIKEKMFVGEAIIATVTGIAFSGYAAGIFAPRVWAGGHHFDEITLELTRIVIALSVFAVGVELPKAYVLRHWKSLAILLGPVMLFGWMVSGALMYAIIPGLEFLPALVVAAGVTPTDPILASSVVGKGKFAQDHVPAHIRHILQAESGSNDGAAFPFLYLALFLLLRGHHSIGDTIGWWIVLVILYQIILGIFIGAMVGIIARKLLKFSKRRELIDRESMVAMYVSLALFVTGVTTLAGSDDLLAAFACGTAFAWDDWFTESIEESNFSSTVDLLANCAMFIYLGATMPFSAWNNELLTLTPWRLVLLALGILALRRLPCIISLQWWIPDIKTRREAIFAGHFGPMGVGAIFISTLAAEKLPTPRMPPEDGLDILALTIQPITYFIVLSSILIHGLTISFFSLGRRVHSRVTSISRTITATSITGDEPSWMSRVKRARNADEIVVNRDDDMAEKGEFPTASTSSKEKENDEHPEKNVLEDGENREELEEERREGLGRMGPHGSPKLRTLSSGSGTSPGRSAVGMKPGQGRARSASITSQLVGLALGRGNPELEQEEDLHRITSRESSLGRTTSRTTDPLSKVDSRGSKTDALLSKVDSRGSKNEALLSKIDSRGSKGEDQSVLARTEISAKERRYCQQGETRTWTEGRKVIIDHNDGSEPQVVELDPTDELLKEAEEHPNKSIFNIPRISIEAEKNGTDTPEEEESALKKAALGMFRRGSLAAATQATINLIKPKDDGLSQAQRDEKIRKKLERDAWCRQEKVYRDRDPSPAARREWIEGDQIVSEGPDGETVTVRELSQAEKDRKAAKHLAALKALGRPLDAIEAALSDLVRTPSRERDDHSPHWGASKARDYFSIPGKGKEKASSPSSTGPSTPGAGTPSPGLQVPVAGSSKHHESKLREHQEAEPEEDEERPPPKKTGLGLGLEKTTTIRPGLEDEEASTDEEEASRAKLEKVKPVRSNESASGKRGSSPNRFTKLFRSKEKEEEAKKKKAAAAAAASGPAIRFTTPDRPARDGTAGTGRALPVVGGSLSMRKVPTIPKSG